MMGPTRFSHFTAAIADTRHWSITSPNRAARELYTIVELALLSAQRFYLPESCNILEGKPFDAETTALFRLPFDCIAVLSETFAEGGRPREEGWKITIAIDPPGAFNRRYRLAPPTLIDNGFVLLSLVRFPSTRDTWFCVPAAVACVIPPSGGIDLRGLDCGTASIEKQAEMTTDFCTDMTSVANLCTMLSLHNVRTKVQTPPAALQKRRTMKRQQPLLDYHVLTVDGDVWDAPSYGIADSDGVRSHMRRGHIRRLDSERRVWVRSTYVRGSRPGFVEKDYAIANSGQAV